MAPIVKEVAMVEAPPSALSIFERLASNDSMDVEKLERLMQMHERMAAKQSEELFNASMSRAQEEMRPIAADASNPMTKSRYASYSAIDKALRPIYTRNGFGLSFDTADATKDNCIRVLCYVTHSGGHKQTYHVDMPADGKGAKGGDVMTLTHAAGAAMSYGMRYLVKMIFNVAVGEDDRDGNAPEDAPTIPRGYEEAMMDLAAATDEGPTQFAAAFRALPEAVRLYATKHDRAKLEGLKAKAKQKAVKL